MSSPRRRLALLATLPLALVLLAASPAGAAAAPSDVDAAARRAAEEWLALVDQARYAESWRRAGTLFRAAVTEEQWVASLEGVRAPLGALVRRELSSMEAAGSLPGAPDGDYRVLQLATSFAAKRSAVETVTVVRQEDGWRVVGYFIR